MDSIINKRLGTSQKHFINDFEYFTDVEHRQNLGETYY